MAVDQWLASEPVGADPAFDVIGAAVDATETVVECQALPDRAEQLAQQAVERVRAAVPDAVEADDACSSVLLPGGATLRVSARIPGPVRAHRPNTVRLSATVTTVADTEPDVVTAALTAVRRMPLTKLELAELHTQMPLTVGLADMLPAHALRHTAPLLVIHHMFDFLVMAHSIMALGVPAGMLTVLDKGYAYKHTDRVDGHLRALGVRVWPWQQAREALIDHARRARAAGRRPILVDDGGYTLPVLLSELPHLASAYAGLVEQTKSGIFRLEPFQGRIPIPVFSVAESRLKSTVESYGIADAAVRNILALLPDEKWEGQPALVVGFGRIGEQVAEVLQTRRMRVAVYDTDIVALVAAHERGYLTSRALSSLLRDHRPLLVVGTTGRTSVRGDHLMHLRRDAYLVSVTSRQRELALDEFAELAVAQEDLGRLGIRYLLPNRRAVTILADGFPINFHHAESLPNRYSDLILAAMIIGAATLATPRHGFAPGHNVARTDAVLNACGVVERYYQRYGPRDNS